jgi:type II restriction enzyme
MPPRDQPLTALQARGAFGERCVTQNCECPRCKRRRTLIRLPTNFNCADVICDFCGYLAQVKTSRVKVIDNLPRSVLGAAWEPQKQRMDAAIYFPLFLVLVGDSKEYSIFYLSADLQTREMLQPRSPLSSTARLAGWQGFVYNLVPVRNRFVLMA